MATTRLFPHTETVEETRAATDAIVNELRLSTVITNLCIAHSRAALEASLEALKQAGRNPVTIAQDVE